MLDVIYMYSEKFITHSCLEIIFGVAKSPFWNVLTKLVSFLTYNGNFWINIHKYYHFTHDQSTRDNKSLI